MLYHRKYTKSSLVISEATAWPEDKSKKASENSYILRKDFMESIDGRGRNKKKDADEREDVGKDIANKTDTDKQLNDAEAIHYDLRWWGG